ncbi:MAG TPA: hypothetical protein ENK85_05425 [Saprospiraceae bacterium]|nr:hypothetical protein [Saprospiraceae bacterium]
MKKSYIKLKKIINKLNILSFGDIKITKTFVISETEKSPKGHPIYRFIDNNTPTMLKNGLYIIFFVLLFAQANGQVTFRAIGDTSSTIFDVGVQVTNFTDVAAFEYTMTYDTTAFTLLGLTEINIQGSLEFFEPQKGIVKFSWIDNTNNVTIPDNTVIYKLRFSTLEKKVSKVRFVLDDSFIVADSSNAIKNHDAYFAGINAGFIEGVTIYDFNENCQFDAGENGINDLPLRVERNTFYEYTTSNTDGQFEFVLLDTGNVNLKTLPRTTSWLPCTPTQSIDLINYSENRVKTLLQPNFGCPHMEVDISSAYVKPCETIKYWVDYRNNGTSPAFDASVHITLDSFMTYAGSSLAPAQLDGKHITFNIGNIAPDHFGRFSISVSNSCIGTVEGQAQCMKAEIFPKMICDPVSPAWDHSSVQVNGICKDDSVQFTIKNVGSTDMSAQQDYIIIEDMIIGKTGQVQLPSGGTQTLSELTAEHTYRLIVNQSANHPGKSYPTVALEGCDGYNTGIMLGSVTEFAEDDADYFISIDCQESTNTPTPNTITGHPKGYGPNFEITSHTDLTYLIYFKNVTPTTLTRLVIRDSLSENLNIISVQPGASSLPYDFTLSAQNIVMFTFDNVSIPPDGEGFVKFRVSQMPNNPVNTQISTHAQIIMGEDTIALNPSLHTIGGDNEQLYVMVDVKNPINENVKLDVRPNPFLTEATIEVKEYIPLTDLRLRLYRIDGSVLVEQSSTTGKFRLSRSSISKGVYVFVIEDGHIPIASGKIIAP